MKKIVFTSKGTTWNDPMDPRFGRTPYFLIYNEEEKTLSSIDNRDADKEAHGAGTKAAQRIYEINPDVIITGNGPGGNAASVLQMANIEIYTGAGEMNVAQAYEAYQKGELIRF